MPKDFSHQDLCGKSFKDQDLTGADFSHADIRGVSFKGAILKCANFSNAKGGVTKSLFGLYIFIIFFLSAIAGFLSLFSCVWVMSIIGHIIGSLGDYIYYKLFVYTLSYFFIYYLISIIFIKKRKYSIGNISIIILHSLIGYIAGISVKTTALSI